MKVTNAYFQLRSTYIGAYQKTAIRSCATAQLQTNSDFYGDVFLPAKVKHHHTQIFFKPPDLWQKNKCNSSYLDQLATVI